MINQAINELDFLSKGSVPGEGGREEGAGCHLASFSWEMGAVRPKRSLAPAATCSFHPCTLSLTVLVVRPTSPCFVYSEKCSGFDMGQRKELGPGSFLFLQAEIFLAIHPALSPLTPGPGRLCSQNALPGDLHLVGPPGAWVFPLYRPRWREESATG